MGFTRQVHGVNVSSVMTETKAAYHHGDLRHALVATATALVRASGADTFSLRDAARNLGVSANATYRHFENKSALLTAVVVASGDKLGQKMRRKVVETERALERTSSDAEIAVACLKATCRAYVAFAIEEPALYRVMHGPSGLCRLSKGDDPRPNPVGQIFTELLDRLVRAGALTPAARVDADVHAWMVIHGFASLLIEGANTYPSNAKRAAAFEELLDFTLRGLGVKTKSSKK